MLSGNTCYNTDEPGKDDAQGKNPDTKGLLRSDSIDMESSEQANLQRQKADE